MTEATYADRAPGVFEAFDQEFRVIRRDAPDVSGRGGAIIGSVGHLWNSQSWLTGVERMMLRVFSRGRPEQGRTLDTDSGLDETRRCLWRMNSPRLYVDQSCG